MSTIEKFAELVAYMEQMLPALRAIGFGGAVDVEFDGEIKPSLEKRFQALLDATEIDFEAATAMLGEMEGMLAAAVDSVQYRYIVDAASSLSSVSPAPTEGDRAFVRITPAEHVYEYRSGNWGDLGKAPSAGKANVTDLAPLRVVANQTARSFEEEIHDVATRQPNGGKWARGDGHFAWAFGVQCGPDQDIVDGAPVSAVSVIVDPVAGVARVRLRVWRRPTDAATMAVYPGLGAADELMFSRVTPVLDAGLVAGTGFQKLLLKFDEFEAAAGYTYLFEVRFYDTLNANAGAGMWGSDSTGLSIQQRGFFDGQHVIPPGRGVAWALGVAKFAAPGVERLNAQADLIERSFDMAFRAAAERPAIAGWRAADGHFAWAFGIQCGVGRDIAEGIFIDSVVIGAELSPTVERIRLRVWRRPTDAGTYSTYPGVGANDVLLFEQIGSPAELGMATDINVWQPLRVAFPAMTTVARSTYLFEIRAYDAESANAGLGIQRGADLGYDAERRGWFRASFGVAPGAAIAWQIGSMVYVQPSCDKTEAATAADTRDSIAAAAATSAGLTVSIEGQFVRGGAAVPFAGAVTLTAPTSGDVVSEARTLTSRNGSSPPLNYYNAAGGLAYSNVSAVVVRDASTSAVLVLGTDYALEPINGYIGLQTAGANRAVTVGYHWSQQRYDLICVHADTRALVVVQGTERRRDAGEFLPVPSSSALVPLFYARVAGSAFAVELIPIWYLDGAVHRALADARRRDYENQRRALAPVIDMARRGETIRIVAMGDSIGSQSGGGTPPNTSPNGPFRDRPEYFGLNIGADLVSAIPRYDTGDGAGAVHTRTTHIWDVIRALQELGGTVEYYNCCIGGTTSGSGTNNGGDAVLRATAWSTAPHLLVTHYGMNETGDASTEANLVDLFAAAGAAGVRCVLALGMPRPGGLKAVSMADVRTTWRATRRAAEAFRVGGERRGAYFAAERLVDAGYDGAMGLAAAEYGGADKFHHPGLHEYRVYGAEIKAMIKGQ